MFIEIYAWEDRLISGAFHVPVVILGIIFNVIVDKISKIAKVQIKYQFLLY